MKTSHKLIIILLALLLPVFPSCELDEDGDPSGDLREKFTGTWRFNESEVKSTLAFYNVLISIDPGNSSQVLLRNFANIGNFHSAYGIVTTNRITIPQQTIASLVVSGTGNLINNSRMEWTYSVNDGADLISYSAVAEKQ
jgi:hypothetical protein